jgi:hypothetical protein
MILLKLAGLVSVSLIYHGIAYWWDGVVNPRTRRSKAQQKRRSRFLLRLLHDKQMQLQQRQLEYNAKKRKNKFYK